MSGQGVVYLLVTFGLFAVFAAIVVWTYRGKRKKRLEEPKNRMIKEE